jgi:IS30 family transposase
MMCVLVNQAMQIEISKYLNAKPYERSHERLGQAHGLIRQYFPKGTDFADLTDRDIERVMLRLNHSSRKWLGYKISSVVFLKN